MSDVEKRIVERAVDQLGEHFDSVQVFVTKYDSNDGDPITIELFNGSGNWLTRYGQVKDWVLRREAIAAEESRRSV